MIRGKLRILTTVSVLHVFVAGGSIHINCYNFGWVAESSVLGFLGRGITLWYQNYVEVCRSRSNYTQKGWNLNLSSAQFTYLNSILPTFYTQLQKKVYTFRFAEYAEGSRHEINMLQFPSTPGLSIKSYLKGSFIKVYTFFRSWA